MCSTVTVSDNYNRTDERKSFSPQHLELQTHTHTQKRMILQLKGNEQVKNQRTLPVTEHHRVSDINGEIDVLDIYGYNINFIFARDLLVRKDVASEN